MAGLSALSNTITRPEPPQDAPVLPRVELDGRLIAVSNRVARPSGTTSPGGLAQALGEALKARGGTWVGWSGQLVASREAVELDLEMDDDVVYALLDLFDADFQGYYEGYANGVLWPIFHGRPDLSVHDAADFEAYKAINRAFAEAVARMAGPEDTIWVHDYQLLMLGEMLREAGVSTTIGLFLHIPFPYNDVFRTIPEAEEIARALVKFDTIGVQTTRDARNLAECLAGMGEGTVHRRGKAFEAHVFGEHVRVVPLPIGIDVAGIQRLLRVPPSSDVVDFSRGLAGRRSLIGVDRLDYSKGLPQKLQAFHQFLTEDPSRARDVVLTQIAPISRGSVKAYEKTRREVEAIAGCIAGMFTSLTCSPLNFLTRPVERGTIAHLMARSDVALVTPIADGMNLVAKEYVAVQNPRNPGVLVLSEFAGAAEAMTDALLVNPHDTDALSEAIERALSMPLGERRDRHAALMDVVRDTDIARWSEACLAELSAVKA
ncbi:trehalose-6-phosphate synthase [Acuticoccus sp. M5D2P5]|uniref:alpha,alpha-trehalose-phosphate synthase (UDP-forming) n=1 Tax=Acuticoccus kalidii TaxID=2910977 RepID=UPI001F41B3DA|nr:trehalose-6-phosphate synthase [Acuticoccus kalidii]MCF3932719.1 trehalose-6-phosphate synthase [Acuticoccus kalidii]